VVRQLISEIGQLDQAIADGAVSWHRYVPIERVGPPVEPADETGGAL
jgi:hypothetical protein